MVFDDAPVLRTENKLLLKYEGVTEGDLLEFAVLSSFSTQYGIVRRPIETGEDVYLENSETLQTFSLRNKNCFFLFGEFEILENFKTNIVSLTTVFYFENFMWRYMPAKLILNT